MEVQHGLTAVDGGIEGAFKEVLSAERKAFIGHLKRVHNRFAGMRDLANFCGDIRDGS